MLIAGGGTGGHLYPGLALAREFERRVKGSRVIFVGTSRGLEARLVPQEGYELQTIRVRGWVGQGILKRLLTLLELPYSLYQSFRLLRGIRPDLVIGVGGYASGPVVLTAWLLRVPRVLVEPNSIPGWTNRILSPLAGRIYAAFEEARNYLSGGGKIRVLGNPVRAEIVASPGRDPGRSADFGLLVMGGSQGAHAINKALVEALPFLKPMKDRVRIIHQTGTRDYEWVREAYERQGWRPDVTTYLNTVWQAYADCDLVISRSGAATAAELAACGRPAILIPYPRAAHGHQEANARVLERAGAAEVILDSDLSGERLAHRIRQLLSDPARLSEMARRSRALGKPQAAQAIVSDCLELVRR